MLGVLWGEAGPPERAPIPFFSEGIRHSLFTLHSSSPSSQTVYVSENNNNKKKYRITCTSLYLKEKQKEKKEIVLFSFTKSISILCFFPLLFLFSRVDFRSLRSVYLFNFKIHLNYIVIFPVYGQYRGWQIDVGYSV